MHLRTKQFSLNARAHTDREMVLEGGRTNKVQSACPQASQPPLPLPHHANILRSISIIYKHIWCLPSLDVRI